MYIPHLFICLSIEHLGFFHLLTIMSSAAMNILVQVFVLVSFQLPFKYLRVELLSHMTILFHFLRDCYKVWTVLHDFYIPPGNV